MLGLNGGLIGRPRSIYVNTGVWTPNQQRLSKNDPNWNNVSLLLHMDGSNGSTTFTDSSSNALTVTANGNAQISTAQSKFGGASGAFDGTGDYLSIPNNTLCNFGTGDFTVEAWIYPTSLSATSAIAAKWNFQSDNWLLRIESASQLKFWYSGGSVTASASLVTNSWQHIAVSRTSGSLRLFVNGIQVGSTTTVTADLTNNTACTVGSYLGAATVDVGASFFNGYIDDLRITKGVARYTANFTASTAPFPDA